MAAAKKAAGSRALTLHDHIKELRNRFFGVAIIFIVVSAVAYNYKETLLYYLLKPLGDQKLIYLNPAGGFSFIFQVTMYVGVAAAVPFLIYNLYKFVAPALPDSARKHSVLVIMASLLLLCCGVAFGYLIAIPGALNFLNHFGDGYVTPSLTADSYLNFILAYTAGLGILFQLPLILLLIHWVHPLKPLGLFKFERYMILISFVAAAMITPTPDVVNQLIIALPIIVMYQAGVIAICISIARAKHKAKPPKLSRAERKTQKKAEKLLRKKSPIPVAPIAPVAAAVVAATKPQIFAPQFHDIHRTMKPDVSAPVKKTPIKVVSYTQAVSQTEPKPLSQTRKSMDIMMMPAHQLTERGGITRPDRPLHHRTPQLQVPQRGQPVLRSRGISSVDGISVI